LPKHGPLLIYGVEVVSWLVGWLGNWNGCEQAWLCFLESAFIILTTYD